MDDLMKALGYFPFVQRLEPREEKGVFVLTFNEDHMGRITEVIDKIRKNTKLKFKYIATPGMEEAVEMEATPNETKTEGKQHSQTATKHLPTFVSMRSIHVARIREDGGKELLL